MTSMFKEELQDILEMSKIILDEFDQKNLDWRTLHFVMAVFNGMFETSISDGDVNLVVANVARFLSAFNLAMQEHREEQP